MDEQESPGAPGDGLRRAIADRISVVGVIGLGYVGLPLALACADAGFPTLGFDIDPSKIDRINAGQSYIDAAPANRVAAHVAAGRLAGTADFAQLARCDIIAICVPTPLGPGRAPDLSFVEQTTRVIARHLRPGQMVVLESTTFPGTTDDVVRPLLEQSGLRSGTDFFLGFSPEREDPGNDRFTTRTTPKIVAGDGEQAAALIAGFYGAVVERVAPVSSTRAAEAVKLTENIFRAVNIALVNELKVIYGAMDVDVWEVIAAASTKPFGYMPFYPGPGLGGHCIPIDPFYLTWQARQHGLDTRFIELAGEINTAMPDYVVARLAQALDQAGRALAGASVLMLGLAYKKNVSDVRESPAFALIRLLEERGAQVMFHDPLAPGIPPTRDHAALAGRRSVPLTEDAVRGADAVLIVTDHDAVDYRLVADHARILVDTRNVIRRLGLTPKGALVLA